MPQVTIVNQQSDRLCQLVNDKLPGVTLVNDFNQPFQGGVLCWLPGAHVRVDEVVQDLVHLVDHSAQQPTKIVMNSIMGTADDATVEQLQAWYGEDFQNIVADHLYAIKMIDELELPYTIVRSLPLTTKSVDRPVMDEGQPVTGDWSNVAAVATTLAQACDLENYLNQSVGI
ncbi:NAD(P)H-binding protein [Limosilactobacillus caecicola]|uniref:NAD(P)H-binding protein n=1 Tax=Limosilactobacillus caecicola TaxID=2941332 RepID=UPI00203B4284|nr:NAD(P)H-binding protein [Limosilactobacillus caecicola]